MGRKKRNSEEDGFDDDRKSKSKGRDRDREDSDDEPYDDAPRHYDIDPDIQELAYTFNIDPGLTQRLNDIMIEERQRTWEQDIARLYEILKDAHTPAAMLNLKLRDMEKGTFVGKAKCQGRVREIAAKHRLDKGASSKLEEAMSMREAMGKDVEKDLFLLDEHLQASNAPSKLISMKLDSLRKGFNIGHCIYSREPMPGNQGPGVDGVFDKRTGKRTLGYTDADLDKRFAAQDIGGAGGALMDEATVRKLMAQERKQHQAKIEEAAQEAASRSPSRPRRRKKEEAPQEAASRSRSRPKKKKAKDRGRSPSAKRRKSRSSSSPRGRRGRESGKKGSRARSGSPKKRSRGRSASGKRKRSRSRKKSRSRNRSRERSGSGSPRKKDGKEKKSSKKK